MELVAVLDPILRAGKYSPLLEQLWIAWRANLQFIFASPSNDSAIYNLFYNDMKNRVAVAYLTYINEHPTDKVALTAFINLAHEHNILRYGSMGNTANEYYYDLYNKLKSDK